MTNPPVPEMPILDRLVKCVRHEKETGNLYWTITDRHRRSGEAVGFQRPDGRKVMSFQCKTLYQHRVIFYMNYGYLPKDVDHIDGDPSNNKIENLRAATRSQNNCNQKLTKQNTTGVKGVTRCKKSGKYKAQLKIRGRNYSLGLHQDLDAAREAVVAARLSMHGEFARHD